MYEAHFGLSGLPFNPGVAGWAPYPAAALEPAVRGVVDAIARRQGYMLVLGDAGCGKTIALHRLAQSLDAREALLVPLVASVGSPTDPTGALLDALGVPVAAQAGRAQRLARLELALETLARENRIAVLAVDDAQWLGADALAELSALNGLHDSRGALLQIVLFGRPALRDALQSAPAPARTPWRSVPVFALAPMDATETQRYVEHQLHAVGWAQTPAFLPTAWDRIQRHTGGVPAQVNRLAHRLLLTAHLSRQHQITPEFIDGTAAALQSEGPDRPSPPVPPAPPRTPSATVFAPGFASTPGPAPIESLIPADFRFVATANAAAALVLSSGGATGPAMQQPAPARTPTPAAAPPPAPAPTLQPRPQTALQPAPHTAWRPPPSPAVAPMLRARLVMLALTAGTIGAAAFYSMRPATALPIDANVRDTSPAAKLGVVLAPVGDDLPVATKAAQTAVGTAEAPVPTATIDVPATPVTARISGRIAPPASNMPVLPPPAPRTEAPARVAAVAPTAPAEADVAPMPRTAQSARSASVATARATRRAAPASQAAAAPSLLPIPELKDSAD